MIQFNAGTARITPKAEPWEMMAVGSVRFSSGNHLNRAWTATEKAGPSPAPRMMRQATSVVNPTVPIIGNWTIAHTSASPSSTQRVAMRLMMKPKTTAESENRKKNADPRKPNSLGVKLQLVHDGDAGQADHDLVGEIHEHVEKQEEGDPPRTFRRRLLGHVQTPEAVPSHCRSDPVARVCGHTRPAMPSSSLLALPAQFGALAMPWPISHPKRRTP